MTDYNAESSDNTTGTTLTARTLAATGDTVPGGSRLFARNTGAGSHTITFTNNYSTDTGAAPNRVWTLAAGVSGAIRVNRAWADSNNRVAVAVSGTVAEVTTYITD